MVANKFLLIISLIPVFIFVGVNAVKCVDGDTGTMCEKNYCYYVNYTKYENGVPTIQKEMKGCIDDFKLRIPDQNGAEWTFPINHCQHFQTNQTATTYEYFYGNICNTRDNCTYNDSGNLVCAGFRTTFPALATIILMFVGCFIAKIIFV